MSKRSRALLIVLFLIVLGLIALLLARCHAGKTAVVNPPTIAISTEAPTITSHPAPSTASAPTEDVLTPATVTGPATVAGGTTFSVQWKGPNNPEDYITLVKANAPENSYGDYKSTHGGSPLELTAPLEAGPYEARYIAGRAHQVLGRTPIGVLATAATLTAPAEGGLGITIQIAWTGPNGPGDFITIVARDAPDQQSGNYALTSKGSPLSLTLPVVPGDAEIRYIAGREHKVPGRRAITITVPDLMLSAPAQVAAGSTFAVTWRGPNNPEDYITVVPKGTPDGQYRNYTATQKGSPLKLLALIDAGEAELRYMTGAGARVLARRPIQLLPVTVTLQAAAAAPAGSIVDVTWTGPAYGGDYITIVPASAADRDYAAYQDAKHASPAKIAAPKQPGPAEIRYVSGQGARVLGRRALTLTAAPAN